MSTLKIGVVGAGAISPDHINGCNMHERGEVIAVADVSAKRAKKRAKEFDVPRVYTDPADLFADADVDAVTIAVPNRLHVPLALAALDAGKHVCLDKPFATSAKDAKKVVTKAKRKKKVFNLAMNWRFMENTQVVRELVRRGDLGGVYHAKTYVLRRSGCPKFGTWFCKKDEAGGGALYDLGVHLLDACLYVIDNFEPEAVSGAVYTEYGPRGLGEGGWGDSDVGKKEFTVDDFGTALIKLKGGATVGLDASWVLQMEQPVNYNVEVFGDKAGALVAPPKLFRFGKKKGEYEVVEPQGVALRYPHCNRFCNFVDAVLGEDDLEMKPEQALAVQKILDAVYASSRTGKEVRIRKSGK